MRRFWKRGCAVAVSLAMIIAPVSAFAAENEEGSSSDVVVANSDMNLSQDDFQESFEGDSDIFMEDSDTANSNDQESVFAGDDEDGTSNSEIGETTADEMPESDLIDAEDNLEQDVDTLDDLEDPEEAEEPEENEDENAIEMLAVTNGFGQGEDGNWYYYTNGQIDTSVNSVINGTVNGVNAWWYVVGGKVQTDFTGLANYSNENGWWYIENGKVSFTYNGVEKNNNGWYYIKDSKVDFSYNGFATNKNGKWYIENGKVTFNKNSVIKDTTGAIGTKGTWWYVVKSEVKTGFTGLADYSNENGWWYIENGKVTFSKDTIAKNKNGWYYIKDSKVDFSFTGLADFRNENGWYYINAGKVTFNKDTIAKNKNGWYYIKNSKVDFSFTGLADFSNENGWWYCENGKVLFNHTGVEKNKNGWYYVKDSKVDFSYIGIAQNKNGWWYIENGKVLFNDLMTSAAQYLGAHTSSSLSNADRLKECSDYMYHHYNFESTNGIPTASSLNSYAEYFFKYDTGACYHHTAGLACMAKALGFDTIFHEGYISDDTYGMMMHSWCEVYVNGQWLIYDPGQGYAAQKESDIDRVFETRNAYRLTISNGETVWTKL